MQEIEELRRRVASALFGIFGIIGMVIIIIGAEVWSPMPRLDGLIFMLIGFMAMFYALYQSTKISEKLKKAGKHE